MRKYMRLIVAVACAGLTACASEPYSLAQPDQNWEVYAVTDGDTQLPVRVETLARLGEGNKMNYDWAPSIRIKLSDGNYVELVFDDAPNPNAPQHWRVYHYVDDKERRELTYKRIYNSNRATKGTWVADEQESIDLWK